MVIGRNHQRIIASRFRLLSAKQQCVSGASCALLEHVALQADGLPIRPLPKRARQPEAGAIRQLEAVEFLLNCRLRFLPLGQPLRFVGVCWIKPPCVKVLRGLSHFVFGLDKIPRVRQFVVAVKQAHSRAARLLDSLDALLIGPGIDGLLCGLDAHALNWASNGSERNKGHISKAAARSCESFRR